MEQYLEKDLEWQARNKLIELENQEQKLLRRLHQNHQV